MGVLGGSVMSQGSAAWTTPLVSEVKPGPTFPSSCNAASASNCVVTRYTLTAWAEYQRRHTGGTPNGGVVLSMRGFEDVAGLQYVAGPQGGQQSPTPVGCSSPDLQLVAVARSSTRSETNADERWRSQSSVVVVWVDHL